MSGTIKQLLDRLDFLEDRTKSLEETGDRLFKERQDAELKRDGAVELAVRRLAHIRMQQRDIDDKANTIGLQQQKIEDLEETCANLRRDNVRLTNERQEAVQSMIAKHKALLAQEKRLAEAKEFISRWSARAQLVQDWLAEDLPDADPKEQQCVLGDSCSYCNDEDD